MVVVWMTQTVGLGWRTVFTLFGLVGVVWALGWYSWFRNDPSEHRAVNAAELAKIVTGRTPPGGHHEGWAYWKRLLSHRNTLAVCLMYVPNPYAFYFCITWLPTYLEKQYNLKAMQLGFSAGLPLMLSVLGDIFGGATTDWASRRFGLRIGRCAVGAAAYLLAGLAMYCAAATARPYVCVLMISLALTASMFILGAAWATCIDIGGQHSGVVSATMNTAGNIGGMLVPIVTIYLKDWFGTWNAPLYAMSGLFVLGVICWGLIDPRERVFE
jgi:nitrate/nitrite transporter NarK